MSVLFAPLYRSNLIVSPPLLRTGWQRKRSDSNLCISPDGSLVATHILLRSTLIPGQKVSLPTQTSKFLDAALSFRFEAFHYEDENYRRVQEIKKKNRMNH